MQGSPVRRQLQFSEGQVTAQVGQSPGSLGCASRDQSASRSGNGGTSSTWEHLNERLAPGPDPGLAQRSAQPLQANRVVSPLSAMRSRRAWMRRRQ